MKKPFLKVSRKGKKMLVNKDIENELYHDAGETRVQKARLYEEQEELKLKK